MLNLTTFAWGLIATIVITFFLSYMIHRRKNGIAGILLIIMLPVNIMIYFSAFSLYKNGFSTLFGDKYKAVVIDYKVRISTTSNQNGYNPWNKINIYDPIVKYTDKHGNVKTGRTNLESSRQPTIGETRFISILPYDDDTVNDISRAKNPVILFMLLFLALLISGSFFITC